MTTTPPTGNPAEPTRPIPMTPTQPTPPAPPPGPPSGPPSGPPPAPGAAKPKKTGGNIWLVGFIVVAVLFVVALVFAIFSFLGKNDESDKKEEAQKELAATEKELADTRERLGGAQQAGQALSDLLTQAASAADDLKSCTDNSGGLREAMIDALNAVQGGGNINDQVDALNQQIDSNRSNCSTADQSYQDLIAALREAQGE
jgi:flagellar biosynthesis chaperone FliJ